MNFTDRPGSIVVGVDGTPASVDALVYALREAAASGTRVDVVSAWSAPETTREGAQAVQDQAAAEALCRAGERPVISRVLVEGEPVETLVAVSRWAQVLVLGTGRGKVAEGCLGEARCPVLVVPQADSTGVGTTASGTSA